MPNIEFEDEVYSMTQGQKTKCLMELEEQINFLREHIDDLPLVSNAIALQQGLDHNELEITNFLISGFNKKRYSHSIQGISKALDYVGEDSILKTILDGMVLRGIVQSNYQGNLTRYGLNSQEIKSWR